MPVTVAATLVGASSPRQVQVEVLGLTVADQVTVTGTVGSHTWTVRGGAAISAASSQVILRDAIPPVNAALTYKAVVNGTTYVAASAVTVTHTSDYVLSSLDGFTVIDLSWIDNGDELSMEANQHLSFINGRRTPVVRYSAGGGESGTWEFLTTSAVNTEALRAMVAAGAPVVLRTSGQIRDLPAIRIAAIRGATRRLASLVGEVREWSAPWIEVADPLASTASSGATFAHINTVTTNEGGTFADLNTYIASLGAGTFADFNRHDWESAAS